jgi:hypothetical protein
MPARLTRQMNLLDWMPPPATVEFNPADVRGATIAARLSRAVSQALKDCKAKREEVAERMTRFLGGPEVTKAMIDAYASPARPDHAIGVPRFMALIHATGDRRLLQMLADEMGWAVIERRHLPLIEVAELREEEDRLRALRKAKMAQAGRR